MTIEVRDPNLKLLQERIRGLMNARTDHLLDPGCPDFVAYRELKGQIDGLSMAEFELIDIDEMLYRDEDDDQ